MLPGYSPRLAFGCPPGAAGQKIVARYFIAPLLSVVVPARPDKYSLPETSTRPCFRLSLRRGRTDNHYPKLQRALASVHGFVAAARHTLPGFSTCLAFCCRSGAAGLKIIVQNFNVSCFRLSLRRGRTENHCPILQRSLTSVHEYVAAVRHTLPGFSPRLAFGCRSGAAGQKIIARYFNAALLRCMSMSRLSVIRCPGFHRALLSVVAPARPGRKSLPDTSSRLCFGAWICRDCRPSIARIFTASCFRLSLRRGRTENHCPKLHRGPASVHRFVAAARHTLPGFSPRLAFGCPSGAAGQKIIARYFNAALLRCMSMSRLPVIRCPDFHRALLSVVVPARPG